MKNFNIIKKYAKYTIYPTICMVYTRKYLHVTNTSYVKINYLYNLN